MISPSKLIILMIVATLMACAPVPQTALPTPSAVPPTQSRPLQSDADVPRVSPEEALAALESGDAIIVDVRSPDSYAAEHIRGAINDSRNLDQSKWIITYCT